MSAIKTNIGMVGMSSTSGMTQLISNQVFQDLSSFLQKYIYEALHIFESPTIVTSTLMQLLHASCNLLQTL